MRTSDTDVADRLRKETTLAGSDYRVHLDGHNQLDYDWLIDRVFLFIPAQAYVARMISTLAEFPPRQKPASFSIDQVVAKLQSAAGGDT